MHRSSSPVAAAPAREYLVLPVARADVGGVLASAIDEQTEATLAIDGLEHAPLPARLTGTAERPVASVKATVLMRLRGRVRMTLTVHGACFVLEATYTTRDRRRLQLRPEALSLQTARRAPRLSVAKAKVALRWTEAHEGELRAFSARVVDLSAGGLRVEVPPGAALWPEQVLPAELDVGDRRINCLIEPRAGDARGHDTRGIRIADADSARELAEVYARLSAPRLVKRRDLAPIVVTELFRRSGYLALRPGGAPLDRWFSLPGGERISRDVVYRAADGTPLGHVSIVRAYSRAWVGQQLATLRDHEETAACRLALYQQLALHPHLADGDSGHLVCYFDQQKKWHQQFFGRFVDWVADPSLVHATGLDRFELALRPPTAPADGVEVRLAEREDLVAATALVRSQLPELLARAWDVHPERLTSKALHDDYASTPYERGRRALVLSVDGQLQGVALCETSAPELSLFNILNMAQIFLARGRSTPTAAAQAALLTAVSRLYAARGEPAPIVVAPPGTLDPAQHPGLRKEETMGCIVFSGRALGLYTSFLSFTVGSYRSRKQAATSLPHPSRSESNA